LPDYIGIQNCGPGHPLPHVSCPNIPQLRFVIPNYCIIDFHCCYIRFGNSKLVHNIEICVIKIEVVSYCFNFDPLQRWNATQVFPTGYNLTTYFRYFNPPIFEVNLSRGFFFKHNFPRVLFMTINHYLDAMILNSR
jgi:hypothetical protein